MIDIHISLFGMTAVEVGFIALSGAKGAVAASDKWDDSLWGKAAGVVTAGGSSATIGAAKSILGDVMRVFAAGNPGHFHRSRNVFHYSPPCGCRCKEPRESPARYSADSSACRANVNPRLTEFLASSSGARNVMARGAISLWPCLPARTHV